MGDSDFSTAFKRMLVKLRDISADALNSQYKQLILPHAPLI